jgi:hypothetical protein
MKTCKNIKVVKLSKLTEIKLLFLVLKKYDILCFSVFTSYLYQFGKYTLAGRQNFRRAKKPVSSDVGLLTRVPLDNQLSPNLAGRALVKFSTTCAKLRQSCHFSLPCFSPTLASPGNSKSCFFV